MKAEGEMKKHNAINGFWMSSGDEIYGDGVGTEF